MHRNPGHSLRRSFSRELLPPRLSSSPLSLTHSLGGRQEIGLKAYPLVLQFLFNVSLAALEMSPSAGAGGAGLDSTRGEYGDAERGDFFTTQLVMVWSGIPQSQSESG